MSEYPSAPLSATEHASGTAYRPIPRSTAAGSTGPALTETKDTPMRARLVIRLADEDSRINWVNAVHSLVSSITSDLPPLLYRLEWLRSLEPTLFDDPEVTAKISRVHAAHDELSRALSNCWEQALADPKETR